MIAKARSYFHGLADQYGLRFSLTLVSIFGLIKGVMFQIILNSALPYFKRFGITGSRYQSLVTVVAATPWSMKSGLGLLSDTVPFLGYHKRSYIVLVSVLGTLALTCLWLYPITPKFAPVAAFLLLLVNLQVSAVDLLGEAKYAEMMVANSHDGIDIVSFVWGLYSLGSVIGSLISGPLADKYDPRILFALAAPLAIQVALPAIVGWFPEKKITTPFRVRSDKIRAYPGLSLLSVTMMLGATIIGITSALGSVKQQAYTSITTAIFLISFGWICLPSMLRRANLFLFLNNALYLSLSGAMDFFFTADDQCVPNGPHFSMTYYITWATIIGGIASLVGVSIFQRMLQGKTYQMAFCAGISVRIVASFVDIAITKRLNVRLGINDHVFFMLGDAIITQLVAMLDLIPAVVLTSKVCPPGMEAVVFALLVSYQNLGAGVASTLGVGLTEALGIRTTVPCNFDNLPWAITIGHILLPALSFPLIFTLIPNAKLSDNIVPSIEEQAMHEEHAERARMIEQEEEEALSGYMPIGHPPHDDVEKSSSHPILHHRSQPQQDYQVDDRLHTQPFMQYPPTSQDDAQRSSIHRDSVQQPDYLSFQHDPNSD